MKCLKRFGASSSIQFSLMLFLMLWLLQAVAPHVVWATQDENLPTVSIDVTELEDGGVSIIGTLIGANGKPMGGKWLYFYLVSDFLGNTEQVLLGRGFSDYLTGEGKLPYKPKFSGPHTIQAEYQEKGVVAASATNNFDLRSSTHEEEETSVSSSYLRTLVGFGTVGAIAGVWGTMLGVIVWVIRFIRRSKHDSK